MKLRMKRAALLFTASVTVLALSACGSSGTISSLTDSDSTASIAEGAAIETSSILSGSISQAESVVSSVPEIVPQTVSATEITAAPAAGGATTVVDAEEDEDDVTTAPAATVSLTGNDGTDEDDEIIDVDDEDEETDADESGLVGDSDDEISLLDDDDDDEPVASPEEDGYTPSGEGNMGTITGDEVNVRSTPTTEDGDDNVMFTVFYGDEVKILDSEDNWYKIEINGETGWVNAAFVD